MTDLRVETWPITRLREYGKNPRLNDEVVGQMVAAIKEYGFRIPIVARSNGEIVDGHLRFKAAKAMGLESVPVALADDLTEQQVKAFRLLANRSANWAMWNEDLLRIELGELQGAGVDLSLTGFNLHDLEPGSLFAQINGFAEPNSDRYDPNAADAEVPEPPKNPVSRAGDLWLLGEHRLYCGDATNADHVERLLDGARPHLMITDPPYGVNYDANWRNEPGKLNLKSTTAFKGRKAAKGKVTNDHRDNWTDAWKLFPGDVAYVWHGERQSPEMVAQFRECEFEPRNLIVWAKDGLVISRGHYHPQHETCWYLVRKGKTASWAGDRKQATLWPITRNQKNDTGHSTQKPIECMRRPMVNNSKAGDSVYDPFLGSGTTLIAAEMIGRKCFGLEIDPGYCDVIVERWQALTKKQARLIGCAIPTHADGKPTFEAIKGDRLGKAAA